MPWLVESEDAEPWIERNRGYGGPSINYRQTVPEVGTPNPRGAQGSTIIVYV